MEGNLVIVESPAKAGTIQKFLGEGYTVKSSFGHIRDLKEKSLSIDVEHGFEPEYVISPDKKKVVAELKKLASQAGTVWLASDEDREGEAISWHLTETLGLDPAKTKRIAFHEITKSAILHAIENPRELDMNLVEAQQARRVLDRLVGFEISPILWRKIQPKLSAGRVQSVALRLVVDREKEIMAFEGKPYYRIEGDFLAPGSKTGIKAVLDKHFDSIDEACKFLQDSIGATFSVAGVEEKEGTRFPAAPFTTSTLQQEASRVLHMSVSTTMRVAQSLYERGLITYMRTDSTNLASLCINTTKQFIINHFGEEYSNPRQYKTRSKGAQEAHEAIRPTYIDNSSIQGTAQEQKLYSLIWKRTVACQMADAKVLNTTVAIASEGRPERFTVQSAKVLFEGFLKLYKESHEEGEEDTPGDLGLPALNVGEVLSARTIKAECKFSAAPQRYSEATLVKTLEKLGIGRPATYASIISTLTTTRGYLVKGDKPGHKVKVTNLSLKGGVISDEDKEETVGADRGKLLPQEIGVLVSDYLTANFPNLMAYNFTASVEESLDKVAQGEMQWRSLVSDLYGLLKTQTALALENKEYARKERVLGTAPDGEQVIARLGQYGPYVQKGPAENKQYASLGKGQLVENITMEEALELLSLPRTIGEYEGLPVVAMKGRFGPYLRHGDSNYSLSRGANPHTITLEECIKIISEGGKSAPGAVISEWPDSDISVINGRFGPYIKHAGANYKFSRSIKPETLTEEQCKEIIAKGKPAAHKARGRYGKPKTK